jgi:hypothetical protein
VFSFNDTCFSTFNLEERLINPRVEIYIGKGDNQ